MDTSSSPTLSAEGIDYSVIWIPHFSLQSILRIHPLPRTDMPAAAMIDQQRHSIVHQANFPAIQHGVCPGQSIAQALARCPELRTYSLQPKLEHTATEALLDCARSLSPILEHSATPGLVTNDLRDLPEKLKQKALHRLPIELMAQGFQARIGLAPDPEWALFASRYANPTLVIQRDRKMLDQLPLEVANLSEKIVATLHHWGVHTLGAFFKLPGQGIAERLGPEAWHLWQTLQAPNPRMLRLTPAPTRYVARLDLEDGIASLQPLLFMIRRLLDSICLRLRNMLLSAKALVLEWKTDTTNPPYRRTFRLPEPSRNTDRLYALLHTYLEQVQLDAPVLALSIEAIATESPPEQNLLFQHSIKDPWKRHQTLAQLTGLVGSDNTGSPRHLDSHRPDAFHLVAVPEAPPAANPPDEGTSPGQTLPPMRRFRPPIPIRITLRNHTPARIESPLASGVITATRGPWYSSGEWWDPHGWKRMEWDVAIEGGGLFRLVYERRRWFLEGAYG